MLDDHCRVTDAEIHDEATATAIGVLRRAVAWFTARGATAERVLSDDDPAYPSHAWRAACLDACVERGITPERMRHYRRRSVRPWSQPMSSSSGTWMAGRFRANHAGR